MSTNDTTQTETPILPPLAPAPAERKPVSRLLIALIAVAAVAALAVTTLTITTTQQHGKAVDARESLADTRADLKTSEANLTTSENALADAKTDYEVAADQLLTCQTLTEVSNHLLSAVDASVDQSDSLVNENYDSALTQADTTLSEVEAVNDVLKDAGYDNLPDLIDACDPESF